MRRRFYRIVMSNPPTGDDFLSRREMGAPLHDETLRREWGEGISVFDDFDQAVLRAKNARLRLGAFIATLEIADDSTREIKQSNPGSHHFTIFGQHEELLQLKVVDVVPVPKE